MSFVNNSNREEEYSSNDRSYGFQLESEIKAQDEPTESHQGMRYIADTRRQSIKPTCCDSVDIRSSIRKNGYLPIENYGIIGNLRTVALCGTDGSIDFYCYPKFDSPSIFCRLLDKNKGGHFIIEPTSYNSHRQQYLPSSNILVTRFLSDEGVTQITDYMHIPTQQQRQVTKPLLPWIIRTVRVIRGSVDFNMECCPAFNYALDSHTTKILPESLSENQQERREHLKMYPEEDTPYVPGHKKAVFKSKSLSMDLRYILKYGEFDCPLIEISIDKDYEKVGLKGPGIRGRFRLKESQEVSFIFRQEPESYMQDTSAKHWKNLAVHDPPLSISLMEALFRQTALFWQNWTEACTYKGRWREAVIRSALTLKLLTYEPTGAVVASPTFGIPESIGGTRNWDYRYVWVRDASFTVYAFMRIGFTKEAEKYMQFIESRCNDLNEDGSLNIMYSIDGVKELNEYELDHLEGYRCSSPVRIGNGAYNHLQLDIYGELLDSVYFYNKHGTPISYDMWCSVRKLVNYVCDHYHEPDMSIWEVRGTKRQFTYSLIMCWVAVDRGLRLAEKRVFPCQDRNRWMETRDTIYELIQTKCYNKESKFFTQCIEHPNALDASTLIMSLVFFISPTDPRLISTIERMLLPPEKGGLVVNDLVFRYNYLTTDDGVGGLEGAFSMCTFWLVEALARAGKYDKKLLRRAVVMFEKMLSYSNHVGLFSEEVARSGELLGNFPQAFTHISFVSAAYNLDRVLSGL
ncbi:glycoside hydrolase family 15 protein [Spinellus fusiger]|nr:glycoside hydrolase family 15 protein [Spinellus fusiger]